MSLINWESNHGIWCSLRPCFICCSWSSFSIQQMNDETLEVIEQPCGGGCCLCVHGIFSPYFVLLSIISCNIDFVSNMLSYSSASLIKFVKNPDKSVDCHIKTKSGFKNGDEVFIKNVIKAKALIHTDKGGKTTFCYSQLELIYQEEDLQSIWQTESTKDGDDCKQNRVEIVAEKINNFIRNVPIQIDNNDNIANQV